jgi:hypothetical protein
MASGSSSASHDVVSYLPPVSLVISDHELVNDGSSIVSSYVLHKFFWVLRGLFRACVFKSSISCWFAVACCGTKFVVDS